tara:strand:+ start:534 stop:788 length:255 start_codon:yes stop_codon:yes gene_type:complete
METTEKQGFYVLTAKYYGPNNSGGAKIRVEIRGEKYWYPFDYGANDVDLYLNPIRESLAKFCDWDTEKELTWANTNDGMIAIAS